MRAFHGHDTMPTDTLAARRNTDRPDALAAAWVFGYGSLIYKADFPYLERRPARIRGWARRFWQGSHDHRGTPQAPGRVVTLVAEPDAVCAGMAYLVTPDVFRHLDHREKNGYLRQATELCFGDGGRAQGLVYIAGADNAAFLGPAPEREIARHIAAASGPSGSNRDYLLQLAAALRELGEHDPHVAGIEAHLLALEDDAPRAP
ncbi:MAG: gamma-glutamylcyclotransferase [Mizugakiibacter sp.]|uniref:gamma-glutamylcyclotransferase n=1 Tax=Mizugakiibacter sp. TaxID=1972610 RepID=UPI0031BE7519|nr:gamma-glutamylcyclotransferase [Xanthomonadaceae bacterium]